MRVAPRANLTITLLRHQTFGADRLLGVGPQSLLALPLAVQNVRPDRVDIVQLSPEATRAELLNTPHTACACPPSASPMPSPLPDHAADLAETKKDDVPPPARPNPAYEPADGGGIGLLDLLA